MTGRSRWSAPSVALALGVAVLALVPDGATVARPAASRAADPPLDIRSVSVKPGAVAGGSMTQVKVKVRNTSSQPLSPRTLVIRLIGDDTVLAKVDTPTIPPMAKQAVLANMATPGGAAAGKRTIRVCVAKKKGSSKCSAEHSDAPLTVLAPSQMTISPQQHSFGVRATGTAGGAQAFTVTNTGGVATGPLATSLAIGDSGQFQASANSCNGVTLAAGATCSVTVSFAPTTTGSKSAILQVSASPGGSVTALVTGTGATPADLDVSPVQHAYGGVATGASVTKTFTVTNMGGVNSGALTTVVEATDVGHFGISDNTCSGQLLAPGATCSVTVSFAPTTTGAKTATLVVSGTPGGSATAQLSGTGQPPPPITFSPPQFDYGAVAVNEFKQQVFTVSNVSGSPVGPLSFVVTGPYAGQFSVLGSGCPDQTLAPGATCQLTVRFQPTKTGAMTLPLQVSTPSGPVAGLSLAGTGANQAELYMGPDGFGSVPVGSSDSRVFTVTNIGGVPTGTLSVSLTGSADFSVTGNTCSGQMLAAGATCSVTVTFTPTSPGGKGMNLTVSGNPGGTRTVVTGGTGV